MDYYKTIMNDCKSFKENELKELLNIKDDLVLYYNNSKGEHLFWVIYRNGTIQELCVRSSKIRKYTYIEDVSYNALNKTIMIASNNDVIKCSYMQCIPKF